MKETRWTYEVLLHDAYGSSSHWYRDRDPKTCEPCAFTSGHDAINTGRERYPDHQVRAAIIDR